MAGSSGGKQLECRCTRCKYNNNGQCGYTGRVVIDKNGNCQSRQDGFGDDPGPF
jgi:hypothetical protein